MAEGNRRRRVARVLTAIAIFGAGAGFWALRSAQGPRAEGSAQGITVLLNFGGNAKGLEQWDGSVEVTGGRVLGLEGRHFSEGDLITGENSWKCVTRKDEVAGFADLHYTEMAPGTRPPVLWQPVGVYVTMERSASRIAVRTAQGNFEMPVGEITAEARPVLGGKATVRLAATAQKLTTKEYEDDEPAIAGLSSGEMAVAWVAYKERADRVFVRIRRNGNWLPAEEVTPQAADIFRCSVVGDGKRGVWVFWSERANTPSATQWQILGRHRTASGWEKAEVVSGSGSNTFHRAAGTGSGVAVVWQSLRGERSEIYLRNWGNGAWGSEARLSESASNWEPTVAAGGDGTIHAAWDSYEGGDYNVHYRSWRQGSAGPLRRVTEGPLFQAHASVAVDAGGRPWVAWNESGVNWGKDQGFLIPTPLATPLHQERWLRVVAWDGEKWKSAPVKMAAANAEHPQIAFDGAGTLTMIFRQWTRRNSRSIGSPIVWENYVTRLEGSRWQTPQPLPSSGSWVEKHAALARDGEGGLWAAWMTDNRPFATMVPGNADVFVAALGKTAGVAAPALGPYQEEKPETIPAHNREAEDVKAIRGYTIQNNGKRYKIYRGDMHRHTDFSQDFKYDGSLLEVYRYARDAAAFDYIAPTDHQAGYDQEYSWWQNQKLVDLFHVPGQFVPLFAYERSLPYPNGHRNIVWAQRGVRTLPIPAEEMSGAVGAKKLFEQLHQTKGISMPHSSGTAQGTDWRDNDPEVEPLMEIYQGYRTSYEYEGAPRAATALNKHAQKSGWQPEGFWWNALVKGYKLGVQASSDHWSTHISYACIVAEDFSREGLVDAMRKRHAYAATDNIVLEFGARAGGREYLMGDAFATKETPRLYAKIRGTGAIKQIDLIKDRKFVFRTRPGQSEASLEYQDREPGGTESWYYVRVLQEDGQLAWSSPIWIKR